ncbi:hydroxyisourate hydrolase [Pseudomonas wadenswilerensis]
MNRGISLHVVDVASGCVAEGLGLSLLRLDGERRVAVCEGRIGADGLLGELAGCAADCVAGVYEVHLEVAAFYRARGMSLPEPAFLDVLVYRFGLADTAQHYHLPFKLTAWGVSCFRGGA